MSKQKKQEATGLDFARVTKFEEAEETITFEVVGPNGEVLTFKGEPVTITTAGSYSKTYQRLEDEFNRKWVVESKDADEKDPNVLWYERVRAHDLAVRARCIRSWYGVTDNGEPVEVGDEWCERIMLTPWIRNQVRVAQSRHANFFGEASGG